MAVKIKKGRALDTINLTPMIDCVFQLLIFFLVATRFAQEDRELEVTLPSASEAKPLIAQPSEIFINVDKDGRYFYEGKFLTLEEIEQVLRRAKANNPVTQAVVVRADKRVMFDFVAAILNACNKVGISDYKIATSGEP